MSSRTPAVETTALSKTFDGEVHALRGPGFAGVQFHPESVLTPEGQTLLENFVRSVQ